MTTLRCYPKSKSCGISAKDGEYRNIIKIGDIPLAVDLEDAIYERVLLKYNIGNIFPCVRFNVHLGEKYYNFISRLVDL